MKKILLGTISTLVLSACGASTPTIAPCELTSINLKTEQYFPEGIASDAQGNIFVGSAATGAISRFDSCSAQEKTLIAPGTLTNVIGTIVDPQGDIVWACNSDFSGKNFPSIVGLDPVSGAVKHTHNYPNGGFCNDLAFDKDGNLYVSDSMAHRVMKVPAEDLRSNKGAEEWLKDERFVVPQGKFGLNGLVVNSKNQLLLSNFEKGALYQIDLKTKTISDLLPDGGLITPDGEEILDDNRLIVVEGSKGQVSLIELPSGKRTILADGMKFPTTAKVVGDKLWVVEGQIFELFAESPAPVHPFKLLAFDVPQD